MSLFVKLILLICLVTSASNVFADEASFIKTLPTIEDFQKVCKSNIQNEEATKFGFDCESVSCKYNVSICTISCLNGYGKMDNKFCVPLNKIGEYIKERNFQNSQNRPDVVWCEFFGIVSPEKKCQKKQKLISDKEAAKFFKTKGFSSFCDQINFGWKDEFLRAALYLQKNYYINCPKFSDGNSPKIAKPKNVQPKNKNDNVITASSGSGFAVSKTGHIVTNNHVIDGCQKVYVHTKGRKYETDILSFDSQNDLALLKGNFQPDVVLPLASAKPQLAEDVYVSGYPFGLNVSSSVKVTKGIISSLTGIGNNLAEIQIDAALQSGNSGGPILDEYGNVVGVAVAKLDVKFALENFGAIPENTNFGVKVNIVEALLDANGVNYQQGKIEKPSSAEFSKLLSNGTYYISCWMTLAQIEAMKTKKVMFNDLK